ncbi:hypothetical protein M513_09582 [Trichuris suis]|uniref:AMP-binding enzyme n=1 Tax=Trichuris suis TaxID=68888 RepID=A0A085LX61_9BILA|nr:hypothetical protein M513_09582 [Trichuris suis]
MEPLVIEASSVGEYIVDDLVNKGDAIAALEFEKRRSVTYTQLQRMILNMASNLKAHGVKKYDIVLLLMQNCIEFAIAWYGCVYAGATILPVSVDSTEDELGRVIVDSNASLCVTQSDKVSLLSQTLNKIAKFDMDVFVSGKMPAVASGDKGFMSLRNLLLPCNFSLPSPVCLDDPATIAFSSGTTGLPKGLLLSHRAVVSSIEIMRRKEYAPPGPSDYIICPLSLIYGYPQYAILHLAMKQGSTVVLMKKYSLEKLLRATNEFQVKQLHIVPAIGSMLASMDGIDECDLSSVEILMNSGSALLLEVEMRLLSRFPQVKYIRQAYGMTECAPATITKQGQSKLGSVGQPAPCMEVKVVNLQSGKFCKRSEVGEIWIRGPTKMIAYLHNPEATKQTVTADGWIKTGDTGYLDDDDHLFVVGRIKELIKYKSKQVAPAELENILLQHPAIKDAAVIGIPKAEVGEVPRAYVCLRPQCVISEEDIHNFIAGALRSFFGVTAAAAAAAAAAKISGIPRIDQSSSNLAVERLASMEPKHRPSRFDYVPPSLNCRLLADKGGRMITKGSRPSLFDILFMSTPPSPVGSSLPLTDANVFADALGVAPIYRQKDSAMLIQLSLSFAASAAIAEMDKVKADCFLSLRSNERTVPFTVGTKRWSSALQLYRQMSNHDIAEHASRQQQTGASNGFQEECTSDDGDSQNHRFVQRNVRCASPNLRSSSALSDVLSLENLVNSKTCSVSCRDIASPHQRSPSYESNILNRSTDGSANGSPGESSLNSLELEAIAAVHELHFAVRDISVSDLLPRTSELIFLNITTLEGQAYCIELTMKGWRVTSLRHDCMNGDLAHLDLHTLYFETVYSLMDTISACYRQRFTDLLALRLRQVQAMSASDSHLMSMPEDLSCSDSPIEASHSPVESSLQPNEQENEACTSNDYLMILDNSDTGQPITINVRRSTSDEQCSNGASNREHWSFRPQRH